MLWELKIYQSSCYRVYTSNYAVQFKCIASVELPGHIEEAVDAVKLETIVHLQGRRLCYCDARGDNHSRGLTHQPSRHGLQTTVLE